MRLDCKGYDLQGNRNKLQASTEDYTVFVAQCQSVEAHNDKRGPLKL